MKYVKQNEYDVGFINSFMLAYEEANRTGKTVPIEGYGGWQVHPLKEMRSEIHNTK